MNLNCPQCHQYLNIPSGAEGSMVTCRHCGHEFRCEREKLVPKVPFAKTTGELINPKDAEAGFLKRLRRRLTEAGAVQYLCLLASLAVAGGCVWLFEDASSGEPGASFLCELLDSQIQTFAIFFACMAGVLMACAGRKHRKFFVVLGLLLAGFVGALPWIFPVDNAAAMSSISPESTVTVELEDAVPAPLFNPDVPDDRSGPKYTEADLRPLFSMINRREDLGVLGVWVVGANSENSEAIKSYLKRMTQSAEEPIYYDRRGAAGGLFVVSPTPLKFDEFLKVAERMGKIRTEDKSHYFVEVLLDREKFEGQPSAAALQDESHRFFVLANLKELSCLDSRRIIAAAKRLANAQPNEQRQEVVARLVELLHDPWGRDAEFVTALASAVAKWADPSETEPQRMVLYVTKELKRAHCDIPEDVVCFLLKGSGRDGLAILLAEWKQDPKMWEECCKLAGPTAETDMIRIMNETGDFALKRSAARILGEIGSEASLYALKNYLEDPDSELRLSAELSVSLIEKRLGKGS